MLVKKKTWLGNIKLSALHASSVFRPEKICPAIFQNPGPNYFFCKYDKNNRFWIKTNYILLNFPFLGKSYRGNETALYAKHFFWKYCYLHEVRQSERKKKIVGRLNILWHRIRFACWVIRTKYERTSLICAMYSLIWG